MTNLEKWNFYHRDIESPQIFIDWAFYYMIGAALERRVWWGNEDWPIFPNIYVIFVAPPGIGKTIAAETAQYKVFRSFDTMNKQKQWEQVIRRGPDSITLEALTQYMHKWYKTIAIPQADGQEDKIITFSSIAFFASGELGNLFKKESEAMIRFLNYGWDCKDFTKETKTAGSDMIRNMCVSLIGSCTPDWIKLAVKTNILNEGMNARAVFVFADRKRHLKFEYDVTPEQQVALIELREHVRALTEIYGELEIRPEVRAWCKDWYHNRNIPLNPDRKLNDYYGRKKVHLMKMATILHFSRTMDLTITIEDCENALELLNITELNMAQALSGVGTNPISRIAAMIADYINRKGEKVVLEEILLQFFDEATYGNETIFAALQHNVAVGKIKQSVVNPKEYLPGKVIEDSSKLSAVPKMDLASIEAAGKEIFVPKVQQVSVTKHKKLTTIEL